MNRLSQISERGDEESVTVTVKGGKSIESRGSFASHALPQFDRDSNMS